MNRGNRIAGAKIDRHPLSDQQVELGVYVRGQTVIAGRAEQAGVIDTAEGEIRFQAGDWILTDNPPTHAWAMREQIFPQEYTLERKLSVGQLPTSEPVADEPQPALSAPPSTRAQQAMAADAGVDRVHDGVHLPACNEKCDPEAGMHYLEGDGTGEALPEVAQTTEGDPITDAEELKTGTEGPGGLPTGPEAPKKGKSRRGVADSASLGLRDA